MSTIDFDDELIQAWQEASEQGTDAAAGNGYALSRPMQVYRWSEAPQVNKAVNLLLDELNEFLGDDTVDKDRLAWRNQVKKVILDLFVAHDENPILWISYSRNRNDYTRRKRYPSLFVHYGKLIQLVAFLEEHGYIEHRKGFKDRVTDRGFQSRMRATPKLIELLKVEGIRQDHITTQREEIILKDESKKLIDFDETRRTVEWGTHVQSFNAMLDGVEITLEMTPEEEQELIERLRHRPDITSARLSRVFNNGRLTEGGRFYGHWVQGLPQDFRAKLKIDGEPTCELDFSGLHVTLCYLKEGLGISDGDMYGAPGLDPETRPFLKAIVLIALNAKNERSAVMAVLEEQRNQIRKDGKPKWGSTYTYEEIHSILTLFVERHTPIKKHFYSGIGPKLQFTDSQIAEKVMRKLLAQGIVCVPIHDSFICKARYVNELKAAMDEACKEIVGTPIKIGQKFKRINIKTHSYPARKVKRYSHKVTYKK